jgi:hypothetical protein
LLAIATTTIDQAPLGQGVGCGGRDSPNNRIDTILSFLRRWHWWGLQAPR